MKKLAVAFDSEFYADLKELSRRSRTSMADLVRYAVDKTYEDELDTIAGERSYENRLRNPSSTKPLDEVMKEFGVGVPDSGREPRSQRTAQGSRKRKRPNTASNRNAAIRSIS
jgi:hypothetical protein